MSKEVELNLRIPNMKVRTRDEHGYPIDHSTIRFKKVVQLPAIPKPGEILSFSASDRTMTAAVVRTDWNEDRGMFVVTCRYSGRSITAEDHAAVVGDPEWRMTPLIE
jgi:hypothetical protein